jgi:microcystin-dependent protein
MFGTNNAYKGVTDAAHIYGSSATGGVYPFNGGGNLILQSRRFDTRDILFVTGQNATPRMVIKGTGFIGIGTVTPTNKLQIGSIGTTGYGGNQIAIGNGTDAMAINSNAGRTLFTSNTSFDFVGAGDFLIYGNNVGIGTTTPTNKLDINGDLRIQTITPGSGADVALVADATGVVKQVAPNPVGEIIIYPMATAPTGYLICDGSAISRTTFSDLFAILGTSYGPGDGATTFNLPDLRGEFVRGSDNGRGLDVGRANGTVQSGTLVGADVDGVSTTNGLGLYTINPSSGFDLLGADPTNAINLATYQTNNVGFLNLGPQAGGTYASRPDLFGISRPRNVAMNYCIRF